MDEGLEDLIVEYLKKARVEAIVLGYQDLAGPRRYLEALIKSAEKAGVPVLAANMIVDGKGIASGDGVVKAGEVGGGGGGGEGGALAGGVGRDVGVSAGGAGAGAGNGEVAGASILSKIKPYTIMQRGGMKIGLVGFFPSTMRKSIDPPNLEGVKFAKLEKAVADSIQAARQDGAQLIFVAGQEDDDRGGLGRLVQLGSSLRGKSELLISSSVRGDDLGATVRSLVIEDGPPVLGVPKSSRGLARADLEIATGESGPHLVWHRTRIVGNCDGDECPKPDFSLMWPNSLRYYCEKWGASLGVKPSQPIGQEEFIRYVLNLLRFRSRTEVAFINQSAFGPEELFPVDEPLTLDYIYRAIPYDSRLVWTRVTGQWLNDVVRKHSSGGSDASPKRRRLIFEGVELVDDKVLVNKRPLENDLSYTVATIEYIAAGGSGLISPDGLNFQAVSGFADNLRDLLLRRPSDGHALTFDKERDFPDLSREFRVRSDFSLGGGVNSVSIFDCPADSCYGKPQLTRDQFFGFNGNLRYSVMADSRDHSLRGTIEARYAANKPQSLGEFSRIDDLAATEFIYRWAHLRNTASAGSFYVPLPSLAQRLETEFNPDDPAKRHLESTTSAGMRFDLTKRLEFSTSFAARKELLRDDDFSLGIEVGYNLPRIQIVELMDTPFHLESKLTYFHALAGVEQKMLSWDNRVSFALKGPIYFNVGIQLFGFSEDDGPFATSLDSMAGIRFDWTSSKQSF